MKDIKITRNNITEHVKIAVPYTKLHNTLQFFDKNGYNAGFYGWNYDYYTIGRAAILTGYRPEGSRLPSYVYDLMEDEAKEFIDAGFLDDPGRAYNARAYLAGMFEELLKEEGIIC